MSNIARKFYNEQLYRSCRRLGCIAMAAVLQSREKVGKRREKEGFYRGKWSFLKKKRKKLQKNLVEWNKNTTFALAFENIEQGWLPEWPNGADCKSAGLRLRWFESIFAHKSDDRIKFFHRFCFLSSPARKSPLRRRRNEGAHSYAAKFLAHIRQTHRSIQAHQRHPNFQAKNLGHL